MRTRLVIPLLALAVCGSAGATDTLTDSFDTGVLPDLWERWVPAGYDPWSVSAPDAQGQLVIAKSADPGGLNETTLAEMLVKNPAKVVSEAVRRMLPKSKLGRAMAKKLKVYDGPEHPHQAQQPEVLDT